MILKKMFSGSWLLTTLLVLAGSALCVRLGIWQLDRLEQRRAFNSQVITMRAEPVLDLNQGVPENINSMEWRAARVTGEYDFSNQVAIRNQYYGSAYGYHLITPLLFNGTVVLVDRGFIPADGSNVPDPSAWRQYDEAGPVTITGQIRLGQTKPAFGGIADAMPENGQKLEVWNNFDIENMVKQLGVPALTVYLQPDMDPADSTPPIPYQPEVDLTEGPHFGYALQWFTFAAILFAGYPFYLRKQD